MKEVTSEKIEHTHTMENSRYILLSKPIINSHSIVKISKDYVVFDFPIHKEEDARFLICIKNINK